MTTKSVTFIPVSDATAECVAKGTTTELRLPLRYVSLVQPTRVVPSYTPAMDEGMRVAFVADVVRATSAAVVDELVTWLGTAGGTVEPIPDCATEEVAASEVSRLFDELLSEADAGQGGVHAAALRYAASVLRCKAVRW